MAKFNLPSYQGGTKDEFRRQLRASGRILVTTQVVVGVIFPLIEAFLVNHITTVFTTPGPEGSPPRFPMMSTGLLILIGVVHLVLLGVTVIAATPLPQFLVEFDEQAQTLETVQQRTDQQTLISSTFRAATLTAQLSMTAVEECASQKDRPLEDVFRSILDPWIQVRSEVFWFTQGDAYYNFSVYLQGNAGTLQVVYKKRDDRLVTTEAVGGKQQPRASREWPVGHGHVGMCFARQRSLFSPDAAVADDLLDTGRPEDREFYRSLVSTPIMVDGSARGVLIVTSSVPNQMEKEIHLPIVELIARLLGCALRERGGQTNG